MTAGARVLLVDDDPDVLRLNTLVLRRAGFQIVTSTSGSQAFALLMNGLPFDVVVTDFIMPEMNGLELVELILAHKPDMPVMMLTGFTNEPALHSLPLRVKILAKPLERAQFVGAVEDLIRSKGAANLA